MQTKIWLITGASQGIGFELTTQLLQKGDRVIATTRSPKKLKVAFNVPSSQLLILKLDLKDDRGVQTAIASAIAEFGPIDYLVNNAGYGLLGGIEEASNGEVQANFDINVFGFLNVTRAVLPYMRKQRSGHIINISSVFGLVAGAAWGIYCATKFAVEAISEALEQEVKPFGIHVTIIEPGYIRTNFLESGSVIVAAKHIPEYEAIAQTKQSHTNVISGNQPGDPVKMVAAIIAVASKGNPPLRLLLGSDALQFANYKLQLLRDGIDAAQAITLSTDYTT
jgi:NAD(P)-dependent dehydrogenase (short-subunit alcohol dehydrogenase family)